MLFADQALARRLENVEAVGNAAAAEAEARLRPQSGACSIAIAGGHAMFVGVDSPITQAFGLGLNGMVTDAEMDELEDFFRLRGSAVFVEACPLADASLTEHFNRRGYHVVEYSNVLARPIGVQDEHSDSFAPFAVRRAMMEEADLWSRVLAEAFFGPQYPREALQMFGGFFQVEFGGAYIAWQNGQAAGAAGMMVWQGVGNFFGDGTPEAFRGRGVQSALIRARLAVAAAASCEICMATTMCGSISQRNYQRHGFQIMYTRSKWRRTWA